MNSYSLKKTAVKALAAVVALSTLTGLAACGTAQAADSGEKTLKVALVVPNKPYAYAEKDGSPAGFEYEVLKKIDDQNKNIKFEYSTLEYQNALIGLKEGKYDLVSGTFFRTPAREKDYLVTKPYNYYFLNLIVNPNSKIKTMEDLNGKSVVPIESTDGRYVAFRDWQKKHPNVKIKMEASSTQPTFTDMIQQVHDGTYDAVYLSKDQFDGVKDSLGYPMKVTDAVDGRDTVFLLNKKNQDAQQQVNKSIEALTKDGTLAGLTKKWFKQDNFALAEKLGIADNG